MGPYFMQIFLLPTIFMLKWAWTWSIKMLFLLFFWVLSIMKEHKTKENNSNHHGKGRCVVRECWWYVTLILGMSQRPDRYLETHKETILSITCEERSSKKDLGASRKPFCNFSCIYQNSVEWIPFNSKFFMQIIPLQQSK